MNYYSLHKKAPNVTFKDAVVNGLAPDRGLYFPGNITPLSNHFIKNIDEYSNHEIAFKVIEQFVGNDISKERLQEIVSETLSFDFPVVAIDENIGTLELFHGPTMAFKDVGARFMARCLGEFTSTTLSNRTSTLSADRQDTLSNRTSDATTKKQKNLTVLVATSGDTGGAVADGFLGVQGVDVVILYPSGKVSDIQEKQLTTLGKNITALEVDGVFDDCQEMVKTAFLDAEIDRTLTSANSINIARWLPQMFYFFFAYKLLHKQHKELVFSVPSGNFGNICAGLMAQKLGLPIKHFVAATNVNDTVPNFMVNGNYNPKPSKATISNAMDVGNPSNFIRIQEIFNNDLVSLKSAFSSYSFTDDETRDALSKIYQKSTYIADPHGAVGYLGLKKHGLKENEYGVFLETAHPVKFLEIVEDTLGVSVAIPTQIKSVLNKEKKSIKITSYQDLKAFLNR